MHGIEEFEPIGGCIRGLPQSGFAIVHWHMLVLAPPFILDANNFKDKMMGVVFLWSEM